MGGASEGDAGVDKRQLALVSVCTVAVVVAAFLAPPSAPSGPGIGGPESGSDDAMGAGEASERGERWDGRGPTEDDRVRRPGGTPGARGSGDGDRQRPSDRLQSQGCTVRLDSEPAPGRSLTVTVYRATEPARGTSVWFNDRFVGRTDGDGRVTGQVPYERQLDITVTRPGSEACQFYGSGGTGTASRSSLAERSNAVVAGWVGQQSDDRPDSTNDTAQYQVPGEVRLAVLEEPYPGETVTLVASVSGVPMPGATVTVDGDRVGQTDSDGTYRLQVPDRDRVRVAVSRGEFSGTTTVNVLTLTVAIRPNEGLPAPGEPATVVARTGPTPATDATVSLDGRRLGTTGADGTVSLTLPVDGGGSVTAVTDRQRTTVPVLSVYAPTVGLAALLAGLGLVATARTALRRGTRPAARLGAELTTLVPAYGGLVVWELPGLAVGSLPLLAVVGYRFRAAVRSGGGSLVSAVVGLLDWLRRVALRVADVVAATADWGLVQLGRLARWLRSLPRSVSGLLGGLGAWLTGLPRRSVDRLGTLVTAPRALGGGAAVAVVALASAQWGYRGGLGAAALVALALMIGLLRRSTGRTTTSTESDETNVGTELSVPTGEKSDRTPTLRELWRQFARRIVPDGWRQRTPVEISHVAIERGLPAEPVETLTDAFRESEYGGGVTADRRELAVQAFESLRTREEDDP